MKKLMLFLVAVFCTNFYNYSQSITGTYSNRWEAHTGEAITYTLTLKSDGTFVFYSDQKFYGNEGEKLTMVKGLWETNNHLLVLTTKSGEDYDPNLTKNLNNNKARYKHISERKQLTSQEKPSLLFYKSKVFYAKNMELFKQAAITTSVD
ncbi:MAG TPA: hypothetical protein PKL92_02920 [Aquaticitalea sp.]|nr:hypothetical protein [Aquaticitalea sp.]HNU59125.1 hypothetical protein [Aquaticitalea sp.]